MKFAELQKMLRAHRAYWARGEKYELPVPTLNDHKSTPGAQIEFAEHGYMCISYPVEEGRACVTGEVRLARDGTEDVQSAMLSLARSPAVEEAAG